MNLNGFSRVDVEEFNPEFHWLPNSALFLGEPRVILEDSVPFLFRRGRWTWRGISFFFQQVDKLWCQINRLPPTAFPKFYFFQAYFRSREISFSTRNFWPANSPPALSLSPRIVILLCVCISQFFHSCVLIEKAFISPSDRYIISFELFLSPSYFWRRLKRYYRLRNKKTR